MLSNAYFLAKFRFDTAENEPAQNFQELANFSNLLEPPARARGEQRARMAQTRKRPHEEEPWTEVGLEQKSGRWLEAKIFLTRT